MKIQQAGSHLDHLLRQTRMHHAQLSMMADNKANMLLTIASVIITLSLPQVIGAGPLKWPLLLLISFALLTVSFAVYAVMPKVPLAHKGSAHPDLGNSRFNLLFFGDFMRLTYPEFEAAMEEAMNDASTAYELQVREIYTLGVFLAGQKYRYLKLAYISLFTGLFVSVVAMLIAVALE